MPPCASIPLHFPFFSFLKVSVTSFDVGGVSRHELSSSSNSGGISMLFELKCDCEDFLWR